MVDATEKFEFKAGDVVGFAGYTGIASIKSHISPNYPVRVSFKIDDGETLEEDFTKDGRLNMWHKEPLLKLIERPKKKVKKTVWVGISDKTNGDIRNTSYAYRSAEVAMKYGGFPVYPVEIEVEE